MFMALRKKYFSLHGKAGLRLSVDKPNLQLYLFAMTIVDNYNSYNRMVNILKPRELVKNRKGDLIDMKSLNNLRILVFMSIFLLSLLVASPTQAKEESTASQAATGAGAVLASCIYSPAKIVYAAIGGLVGGSAYLITVGNSQVTKTIIDSAVRGDYIVTPDHIKGKKKLHFSGKTSQ